MLDLARATGSVALVVHLVAIGCSPPPDPPSDDAVSTSGEIDASGGTIELENRVELEIPEDAVDSITEITVTRTTDDPPSKFDPKSKIVTFEPAGLEFDEPVVVRFHHDGLSEDRTIFWSDDESDGFAALGATDEDATTLRSRITHFSRGFVGTRLGCETDDDCPGSNRCRDGRCRGPSCGDGAANGDETDVDCGGARCAPCGVGEACETDTDCESASCREGTCRDEGACSSDAECDAGESCVAGECTETTVDTGPTDADAGGCRTDADCPSEQRCIDGACQALPPVDVGPRDASDTTVDATRRCSSGADCSEDEICVAGVCVSAGSDASETDGGDVADGDSLDGSEPDTSLDANIDAADAETTDVDSNLDTTDVDSESTDGTECSTDQDCPTGDICVDGICEPGETSG